LLAAGEGDSIAVERGIQWLLQRQNADGTWTETQYTGTGFPKVFYLRYHLYCIYFPLLALSRYHQHKQGERHHHRLAAQAALAAEPRSKRLIGKTPIRVALAQGLRLLRGDGRRESRLNQ
jgi:squalene-hopene/tetraprenyl-beta-curcumene cyclase